MPEPAKPPPKWILKAFSRLNVFVYRLTGGRMMNRMEGSPICLLTMTGRKSGRILTTPLMYTAHGDDVLLVASLGGAPKNPVWYHNLVAHPDITIQVGTDKRRMRARQASADQKAQLWPVVVASYPSFDAYRQKTDRDIPLMICSPAD
ncbi:MAG: hypothetical protein JWP28_3124 [Phenylobacterium sp.]|uniref:nitroreductase family deazaflavin-dependent oxidoreductase n=1 Tax=Phenylobacterium sp. TaxID=1871053 RepID=UPI00262A56EB|nr:nitroreductase family deazaflavin-dependent oxidoreductase [Phenylobacterium sp.]MDB5499093.1 hypothetical protein [Phenylobacterium sp.]